MPASGASERPVVVPRVVAGSSSRPSSSSLAAIAAWPIYRSWSLRAAGRWSARVVAAAIATVAWRRTWGGWLHRRRARGRLPRARCSARGAVAARCARRSRCGVSASSRAASILGVEGPRHGRPARRLVPQPARSGAGGVPGRHLRRCSCCRGATTRIAYAAVPVAIGMVSFGLFFGRTTVSSVVGDRADHALRAGRDRRSGSRRCSPACCGSPGVRTTSGSARSSGRRHPVASACRGVARRRTGAAPHSAPG